MKQEDQSQKEITNTVKLNLSASQTCYGGYYWTGSPVALPAPSVTIDSYASNKGWG